MNKLRTDLGKVLLVWLAIIAFALTDPFDSFYRLKQFTLDQYQIQHPVNFDASKAEVVFVEIDEESLDSLGQWPWPRTVLADAMINLLRQGAQGIALDVLLSEPDRSSPTLLPLAEIPSELANNYGYLDWDEFLADLLGQAPITLALSISDAPIEQEIKATAAWASIGEPVENFVPNYRTATLPLSELATQSNSIGHISIFTDRDGFIRKVPLIVQIQGEKFLNLGAETLRTHIGVTTLITKATAGLGLDQVKLGPHTINTNPDGTMNLAFNVMQNIPRVSLVNALNNDKEVVKDKIIVIGPSALGLHDIHNLPSERGVPGPLAHASIIQQIKSDIYLTTPYWADLLTLTLILLGTLLTLLLASKDKLIFCATLPIAFTSALTLSGWYGYIQHGYLIDYSQTSVVLLATASFAFIGRLQARKKFITKAFASYLPAEVVSNIAKNPDALNLDGELRELSIMFVDMRGFTTISESFRDQPTQLAEQLSNVLAPVSQIVMSHEGTIDKYLGDAVLAFWNAPLEVNEHPQKAMSAALEIARHANAIIFENPTTKEKHPIRVAIGLNTGDAVVGNLGSVERFDYTCIGDTVNTASRLEGLCRLYDVDVIASGDTSSKLDSGHAFNLVQLDKVRLKGKQVPVPLFWVQSHNPTARERTLKDAQDQMLSFYYQQQWQQALLTLEDLEMMIDYPNKLAELYRGRIHHFQANPPGKTWDGVFTANTKNG